jgi:hypothetical protein
LNSFTPGELSIQTLPSSNNSGDETVISIAAAIVPFIKKPKPAPKALVVGLFFLKIKPNTIEAIKFNILPTNNNIIAAITL